jgi:tetratricopeptide (TPR) repeat protein
MEYFQLALEKDPNYAPAYAGMGFAWALRSHQSLIPAAEGWEKSRAYARKALELDPNLAEAHETLAGVYTWYDWNWEAGEKEYRRAIELDPNYTGARNFYSLFLFAMRRQQDAKMQSERALELDPYSAMYHTTLGWELMHEGRLDEAIQHLRKAKDLQADNMYARGILVRALEQKQDLKEAWAEAREVERLLGRDDVTQAMDEAYARGGYWAARRAQVDRLAATYPRPGIPAWNLAWSYATLGEDELALDWLEKAYQEHNSKMPYTNVLNPFDRLRSNPRFQEISRRMKFPPST